MGLVAIIFGILGKFLMADQCLYVASESTLYRLLREVGQLSPRSLERPAQKRSKPRALVAARPDQVYCWDINYLPTSVRGIGFYLYLLMDLFIRRIVGWQVYLSESSQRASELLQDICLRQGIAPNQLTVHSGNGSPMKGETMLAIMSELAHWYNHEHRHSAIGFVTPEQRHAQMDISLLQARDMV